MRSLAEIDPYETLGLSPKADDVVIRAAWKALIQKYHPDSSTAPDAAERAARINAAFKLLVPPEARAAYDRRRAPQPLAPHRPPAAPAKATRPSAPAPWRRKRLSWRNLALAGLPIALFGSAIFYVSRNDIDFPAPVQHVADGIITNPTVAQMRATTRRLLGLDDAPAALTAASQATGVDAGPPPAIDVAAIVATVEHFDALAVQGGDAALTEGRNCTKSGENSPRWATLDNCIALHIAGLAMAEGLFGAPDPNTAYFEQAALALPERYAVISKESSGIPARIDAIRKIVWSTMFRKSEARLRAEHRPPAEQPVTGTQP